MSAVNDSGGRLSASRVAYNPLPWAMVPAGGNEPSAVPPLMALAAILRPAGCMRYRARYRTG